MKWKTKAKSSTQIPHPICDLVKKTSPNNHLDPESVRKVLNKAAPDLPFEDRSIGWLVMLRIFPSYEKKWLTTMTKVGEYYRNRVEECSLQDWHERIWNHNMFMDFLEDSARTMIYIHNDVVRTRRFIVQLIDTKGKPDDDPEIDAIPEYNEHIRRIERALFVFAKEKPEFCYLQGFNEIMTVFYSCFIRANGLFNHNLDFVEAFAFKAFYKLMNLTGLSYYYTTQSRVDNISIILDRLNEVMAKFLPISSKEIQKYDIHPILYSLRWITLLFTQEYSLNNVLLIWDLIFTHIEEFQEIIVFICIAQISLVENRIIGSDYCQIMHTLQNLNLQDRSREVVLKASELFEKEHTGNILVSAVKWFFTMSSLPS